MFFFLKCTVPCVIVFSFLFGSREYFLTFSLMMSKDRKRPSTKSMESILRVRNYRETLPDTCYEQALELFLTEYPNGEMENVIHLDM